MAPGKVGQEKVDAPFRGVRRCLDGDQRRSVPSRFTRMPIVTRLVARLDNIGDVVLAGPAVRAVAAAGEPVVFLAGPQGASAASLLPGVGEVITFDAPWIPYEARPVDPSALSRLIADVRRARVDEAVILTSFHQSPLPLALLLRQAGVGTIAATSVDYPGSLLDTRVGYDESLHEVEQSLLVCAAAGHRLPSGDDGRLRLDPDALGEEGIGWPDGTYVVVHPGASVPARALPVPPTAELIGRLTERGVRVVVSGTEAERALCLSVIAGADRALVDLQCGSTSLAALRCAAARGRRGRVRQHRQRASRRRRRNPDRGGVRARRRPSVRWRPWQVPHVAAGQPGHRVCGLPVASVPRRGPTVPRPVHRGGGTPSHRAARRATDGGAPGAAGRRAR